MIFLFCPFLWDILLMSRKEEPHGYKQTLLGDLGRQVDCLSCSDLFGLLSGGF